MEEIIKEVYEFLTSTQFTMYITFGLAVFAVISKIVTKVQKAKDDKKLANFDIKLKAKEIELNALREQNELYNNERKVYQGYVCECKESIDGIKEALRIAFNSSNLNASAKELVAEKLASVNKIVVEAVEGANKIQEKVVETAEVVKDVVEPLAKPIVEEVYKRVR